MRKTIIAAFTLWNWGVLAQTPVKIGEAAPNLIFEKVLNFNQTSATLADFKDKVVIIDFWATWCSPCIQSLPELERLQAKYETALQVITITSDPADRIKQFLTKKPLKLPVVIDEQRTLAAVFPHRSIPHTVIIDKSGIIKAITSTSQIADEVIDKIINGQATHLAEKKDAVDFDPSKPLSGNENFTYQLTITPFQEGYPSFSSIHSEEGAYKDRRIYATNLTAQSLFEIAHQFPVSVRTVIEVKDKDKIKWSKTHAICFELIVPEKLLEQRFAIMRQHLELYFDYVAIVEQRKRPVNVLRKIKNSPTDILTKSRDDTAPYASYSGKGLSMKNSPMNIVAEFIESQLNLPIIDETGLNETYDLNLVWYNESPQQIHQELNKIGLELVSEERTIKVLVIRDK